jgi:hypothetical protein
MTLKVDGSNVSGEERQEINFKEEVQKRMFFVFLTVRASHISVMHWDLASFLD